MKTRDILRKYKKEMAAQWVETVFSTYPLETIGFLRTKTDPFANPVAHMTREAAGILLDALGGEEVDPKAVKKSLDRFIKLRAVQKFAPGQNMAVIYLLKPILREKILPEYLAAGYLDEYLEMESRLDTLALLAFDMYVEARETVAESRIKEIRNQYSQLAAWARKLENASPEAEK